MPTAGTRFDPYDMQGVEFAKGFNLVYFESHAGYGDTTKAL